MNRVIFRDYHHGHDLLEIDMGTVPVVGDRLIGIAGAGGREVLRRSYCVIDRVWYLEMSH